MQKEREREKRKGRKPRTVFGETQTLTRHDKTTTLGSNKICDAYIALPSLTFIMLLKLGTSHLRVMHNN